MAFPEKRVLRVKKGNREAVTVKVHLGRKESGVKGASQVLMAAKVIKEMQDKKGKGVPLEQESLANPDLKGTGVIGVSLDCLENLVRRAVKVTRGREGMQEVLVHRGPWAPEGRMD